MTNLRRILDDELDVLFSQVPAIAIDGPKAVGRTTTAQQRVGSVLRPDSRASRSAVEADPELVRSRELPLLIDEWQKVPEAWDVVRRVADEDQTGGQFLLVGSAAPAPGATAHSGAGRIGRPRMRPMTLPERGVCEPAVSLRSLLRGGRPALGGESTLRLGDYTEGILASGFPGLRGLTPRALKFQLDSYLRNAVDRDVPEQGLAVRKPEAMLARLRAHAAATASTASYAALLAAATPVRPTSPHAARASPTATCSPSCGCSTPSPPGLRSAAPSPGSGRRRSTTSPTRRSPSRSSSPRPSRTATPPTCTGSPDTWATPCWTIVLSTGPYAYRRPDGIGVVPLGLLGP